MRKQEHPFYGHEIFRHRQQETIQKILEKYKNEAPTSELKMKIWNELQWEKHLGNITIPFKIALRQDPSGKFPEYVEILLDTKV